MGADQSTLEQYRHSGESDSLNSFGFLSRDRTKKRDQLEQFLKSKMCIFPSPDAQVIKTRCKRPTRSALQKIIRMTLNAQPVREENEALVNASDGRTQVLNPAKWPWSVHGLVSLKFDKIACWGTGVLIGPNIVLTAGHNLYHHNRRVFADLKSLQFLPGMNGQVVPFGAIEVQQYFVSPNFIKEEKEDYGILILKEPIGEQTGYFGLACLEPEEIKSKTINVTGYPVDKVASKPNTYEMWRMEGTACHVDQDRDLISYLIDTGVGQNGSGVWYQEGEDYYVCGVHVLGTHFVNKATLLTRSVYKQIYQWMHEGSNDRWLLSFDSIKKLEFQDFQIDTECLSLLAQYNLENLATLNLFSKKIGPEGARVLAQNTNWMNLSWLQLERNNLGLEGAKYLAQNTSYLNLSKLDLQNNNIGSEGAKALAQNTSWTNLIWLRLQNNQIGPEGAKALAQNTSWIKLKCLNLASNCLGVEGAKALSQNASWANLLSLDLQGNEIDSEEEKEMVQELCIQNSCWVNLICVNLDEN